MSGLSDSSAFEAFDRMAVRIEETERRAIASAEVTEDLSGDPLERQFKQLEVGAAASDDTRLLELKQEDGYSSPTSSYESRQLGQGQAGQRALSDGREQTPIREAELLDEFEALENEEQGRA